jgi:hypothetical protein
MGRDDDTKNNNNNESKHVEANAQDASSGLLDVIHKTVDSQGGLDMGKLMFNMIDLANQQADVHMQRMHIVIKLGQYTVAFSKLGDVTAFLAQLLTANKEKGTSQVEVAVTTWFYNFRKSSQLETVDHIVQQTATTCNVMLNLINTENGPHFITINFHNQDDKRKAALEIWLQSMIKDGFL